MALIIPAFLIGISNNITALILLIIGAVFGVGSIVFFVLWITTVFNENKLAKEVTKFIAPLEERYGGELYRYKGDFPYYYKNLKKKNNVYVTFDKNPDNSVFMTISLTFQHNFNIRFTHDIAYDMLGDKLFEGYSSKYEEDDVVRKLRYKLKNHHAVNNFLSEKDRYQILEKLLNAGFEIEFDHLNINIRLNPVNIKDNYYLFRGVEAVIELAGLDPLLMENIPDSEEAILENKANNEEQNKNNKPKRKYSKEDEDILYYGPVVNLIGIINDKRIFRDNKVNFNIPPYTNNTYLISMLEKEIHNNFTGKYIPVGSIIKALIKRNSGDITKISKKTGKIDINTSKGRIVIQDYTKGFSLRRFLETVISSFYLSFDNNYLQNKFKLQTPFISIFRYAFTDPDNFRFSFNTSTGDQCYEIVFYAKNPRLQDFYAIVKKFNPRPAGNIIKVRWSMLYANNIKKYIRHKFINLVNKTGVKLVMDNDMLGGSRYKKQKPTDIENKDKNNNSVVAPDKKDNAGVPEHKFIINLYSKNKNNSHNKQRLRLYSDGVLISQIDDIPWEIKIDLPENIRLIKDMTDFKRNESYNGIIRNFFDYLATRVIKEDVELPTILKGVTQLANELIEDKNVLAPVLMKLKNRLMHKVEYCCVKHDYDMLISFFGAELEAKLLSLPDENSKSLWSIVLKTEKGLFENHHMRVIAEGIKKNEFIKDDRLNKIPVERRKYIQHHLNKSPFKGKLTVVEFDNGGNVPFYNYDGTIYINASAIVLYEGVSEIAFKYSVLTALTRSCELDEREIEREVYQC